MSIPDECVHFARLQAEPVLVVGEDGRVVSANPAAGRELGRDHETLVGRTLCDLSTETPDKTRRLLHICAGSGEPTVGQLSLRRADGAVLEFPCRGMRLRHATDDAPALVALQMERSGASATQEEKLRRSERSLLDAHRLARLGNWTWDIRSGEIEWSEEVYRIFGLDPASFRPKIDSVMTRFHPDDRDLHEKIIATAIAQRQPYSIEGRILLPDGAVRHLFSTSEGTFDEDGNPTELSGIVQDITERKQAEARLKESESSYRGVFNGTDDGIFVHDAKSGAIIDVNRAVCEMVGCTREEALALSVGDFSQGEPPYTTERAFERIRKAYEEGPQRFEWRGKRKNGELFWAEIHLKRAMIAGHERILAVVRDVTERRRAEAKLKESESSYRGIFNATDDAIFIHDAESGAILDVSRAMCEMYGYSHEEALGLSVGDLSPGESPYTMPHAREKVRKAFEEGPQRFEWRAKRKNGEFFWVDVHLKRAAIGGQERILAVVRDITEGKQAEEELASAKSFLDTVVDMSPFAMWVSDAEGTVIRTNRSLRETLELTDEQIVGRYNVLTDTNLETRGVMPVVRDVFEKHEPARFSIPWRAAEAGTAAFDGARDLYIDVSMFPILDAEGELMHVVCQWVDITERKRVEEAARKAQDALLEHQRHETERVQVELDKAREQLVSQTRLATIGQVAASIAHEVRNPLGAVRNAAYYLKRHAPTENPRIPEYLGIIDQEIAAANRVISDMMEMARSKVPVKEHVDLSETVQAVFDQVGPGEGMRCRLSLDRAPFAVYADPGLLRQVMANLLTNAIQVMGDEGTITVEARRHADHDAIMVRDGGPGVSAEHRDRLFEPLFTTKAKGTGLGLTICRQIIERHGGTIDLSDHEGPGAAFCIRLPRGGAAPASSGSSP